MFEIESKLKQFSLDLCCIKNEKVVTSIWTPITNPHIVFIMFCIPGNPCLLHEAACRFALVKKKLTKAHDGPCSEIESDPNCPAFCENYLEPVCSKGNVTYSEIICNFDKEVVMIRALVSPEFCCDYLNSVYYSIIICDKYNIIIGCILLHIIHFYSRWWQYKTPGSQKKWVIFSKKNHESNAGR